MASFLLSVATVAVLSATSSFVVAQKPDQLIRINDDNWKTVLEGEWMVEFMAPWCPACRSFQSTWQGLADWSQDLDVKVAQVDVTESPGLSGRFLVTSLPTVLHVKDGQFRVYSGPRRENDLLSFVDDKKWEDVDPMAFWRHPNTFQMGAVGVFFKMAMSVRRFYNMMSTEYGIPEWACYIIFAVVIIVSGLMLGLFIILCCDHLFPPKYQPAQPIVYNDVEDDKDDESDVIEDVNQMRDGKGEEGEATSGVRRRQAAQQQQEDDNDNNDNNDNKDDSETKEDSPQT